MSFAILPAHPSPGGTWTYGSCVSYGWSPPRSHREIDRNTFYECLNSHLQNSLKCVHGRTLLVCATVLLAVEGLVVLLLPLLSCPACMAVSWHWGLEPISMHCFADSKMALKMTSGSQDDIISMLFHDWWVVAELTWEFLKSRVRRVNLLKTWEDFKMCVHIFGPRQCFTWTSGFLFSNFCMYEYIIHICLLEKRYFIFLCKLHSK